MSGYFSIMGGLDWLADSFMGNLTDSRKTIEVTCGRGELIWHNTKQPLEVMNDKDENLIRMHRIVSGLRETDMQTLQRRFNFILDQDEYNLKRKAKVDELDDFEFLYLYLYLSVGGKHGDEIFKDVFMPSMQGKSFSSSLLRVKQCAYRLRDVCFENLDAVEVIRKYDDHDAFFFIDPPYPSRERYYRIHDLDWERLRKTLDNCLGKWLMVCDISLSPRVGTAIRNKERIKYIIDSHNSLIRLLSDHDHFVRTEDFKMGFSNLEFGDRKKLYAIIANYPLVKSPKQAELALA